MIAGIIGNSAFVSAQKIYYDSLWKVTDQSNAVYYRLIDTISKQDFLVHDYYPDGSPQMEGHYISLDKETRNGNFKWYYRNGNIIHSLFSKK